MNILIVRLGALGDIVHTIPAAAALRAAFPEARIDWLVEAKHRAVLDLVMGIDRVVALEGRSLAAWADVVRREREVAYDIALDFQGLMKSAVLARASGAARVAGSRCGTCEKKARGRSTQRPTRLTAMIARMLSGRTSGSCASSASTLPRWSFRCAL